MKRISVPGPFFTILIISLFSFISCKKDSNNNNSTTNPTVNNDYLSRIVFTSDDGSGTEVLDGTTTYVFDNLKRVIKVIDSSSANGSTPLRLWETKEYFYNGNDTLPYKSVVIGDPAAQVEYDTTTDYYTYNAAGLLIRDTGYYVNHGITSSDYVNSNQTYTYSGTTITGRRDDIVTNNGSSHPETRIDTAHTDANGNIVQNIKHKDFGTVNSTITWDDHPSPFAKLSNFRASFIFPFGETFFYEMPGYNNRLHIHEVSIDGTTYTYDEDYTGRYTYNADAYPTQILNPDSSTPGAYDKITFEYKSL